MLGRGGLVVFGLGQNAQLPEFLIQLFHKGLNTGFDGTEIMILHLLSLGRLGPQQGTAGQNQINPLAVYLLID